MGWSVSGVARVAASGNVPEQTRGLERITGPFCESPVRHKAQVRDESALECMDVRAVGTPAEKAGWRKSGLTLSPD